MTIDKCRMTIDQRFLLLPAAPATGVCVSPGNPDLVCHDSLNLWRQIKRHLRLCKECETFVAGQVLIVLRKKTTGGEDNKRLLPSRNDSLKVFGAYLHDDATCLYRIRDRRLYRS